MALSRDQIVIFTVLWVSYASTYFLRKPLGIIKVNLERNLGLTKSEMGWMDMALLLPYASVQMLFGSVGDKLGSRLTLTVCMIMAGTSMIGFSFFTQNYYMMILLLFINGASQSLCWPAASKAINAWFPSENRNSVFGLFGSSAAAGGIGGTALAIYIQKNYGWNQVHTLPSIVVIALGLLCYLMVKLPPQKVTDSEVSITKPAESNVLAKLIQIPQLVLVTIAIFCLKLVRYCLVMWIPLYLLQELHYSEVQAGMFSTLFEVGGVLGSVLIGIAIDKFFKGKGILGCGAAVTASGVCLILFTMTQNLGMFVNGVLLLFAGLYNFGPDNLLGGSIPVEIAERKIPGTASTANGFVNGFGSFGAMLEGPVIGFVSDTWGFQGMLYLIIGLCIIGSVALFQGARIEAQRQVKYTKETTIVT